jgi:hypothetical protein
MYGESRWEDKYKTWDKVRELNAQYNLPWVIIGDLNEILYSHEKEGGNPRPQIFMQAFRDVLNDCDLEDLGYSGDAYTWKRGRIRERLDRAIANRSWQDMHPEAAVQHLEYMRSDHRPILLDTEYQAIPSNQHYTRKFEAKWLKEESFNEVVKQAWENAGETTDCVLDRLAHMHGTRPSCGSQRGVSSELKKNLRTLCAGQ